MTDQGPLAPGRRRTGATVGEAAAASRWGQPELYLKYLGYLG